MLICIHIGVEVHMERYMDGYTHIVDLYMYMYVCIFQSVYGSIGGYIDGCIIKIDRGIDISVCVHIYTCILELVGRLRAGQRDICDAGRDVHAPLAVHIDMCHAMYMISCTTPGMDISTYTGICRQLVGYVEVYIYTWRCIYICTHVHTDISIYTGIQAHTYYMCVYTHVQIIMCRHIGIRIYIYRERYYSRHLQTSRQLRRHKYGHVDRQSDSYIYIYIYMRIDVSTYLYVCRERERERGAYSIHTDGRVVPERKKDRLMDRSIDRGLDRHTETYI